ncbi:MAG: protein kinase [Planctomycetes bacterium]|nr:protein kinase [Planctomycetota bacterium]
MIDPFDPRIEVLFEMLRVVAPPDRPAILDRECGGDAALRLEVEALLRNDLDTASPMARAIDGFAIDADDVAVAFDLSTSPVSPLEAGDEVDEFKIRSEIGRGGFGIVYLAEQRPEGRLVALKVLPDSSSWTRRKDRFLLECNTLAHLHHRGIAQFVKSGTIPTGEPYFAMEFVPGPGGDRPTPTIVEHADAHGLAVRDRIGLFLEVCDAIGHAHDRLIVHRDLKPSNILVDETGATAQPKIIDFGVAHTEEGALTLSWELVGTLTYMSPEQLDGQRVDARSDLYALGLILFELLTGSNPFPASPGEQPSVSRLIASRLQEPARASRAASTITTIDAAARGTDPKTLAKVLRGDLDTILHRLLTKDPARRFQSAQELAADLQAHLDHRPIRSQPETTTYLLRKLIRRHLVAAGSIALFVIGLIVMTTVSYLAFAVAERARLELEHKSMLANLRAAEGALMAEDGDTLARSLDDIPDHLRGFEWNYLSGQAAQQIRTQDGFDERVSGLAIGPEGKSLLVGTRLGTTTMFDVDPFAPSGVTVHNPPASEPTAWSVTWRPDAAQFAVASFDGNVRVYASDGRSMWDQHEQDGVNYRILYAATYCRDGRWLAVGGGVFNGTPRSVLALHDARTGEPVALASSAHSQPITDLATSGDGRWLASGGDDGRVVLWRVTESRLIQAAQDRTTGAVNAVAFSPDSTLLAVGTTTRKVQLYDVPALTVQKTLLGHHRELASVAFHPNGTMLASASWDNTIRLWAIPDGRPIRVLRGHRSRVNRVAFTPNGRLFSASDDTTVREWPVQADDTDVLRIANRPILGLSILAEGSVLATLPDQTPVFVGKDKAASWYPQQTRAKLLTASRDGRSMVWLEAEELLSWRDGIGTSTYRLPAEALEACTQPELRLACQPNAAVVFGRQEMFVLNFDRGDWQVAPTPFDLSGGERAFHLHLPPSGHPEMLWASANRVIGSTAQRVSPMPTRWIRGIAAQGTRAILVSRDERTLGIYDLEHARSSSS